MPSFSSYTMSYIINNQSKRKHRLWFDVEEEYGTTGRRERDKDLQLWFDVEEEYGTTATCQPSSPACCGLM